MKKTGRKHYGIGATSDSDLQAGIEVGYLYRKLEDELNAIAAKTGGRFTARGLAEGVGKLLLAKAGGLLLDHSERLPEMRRDSTEGHEKPAAKAKVHVRPRHKRSPVKCHHCVPPRSFQDRSAYMRHFYRDHPELVKKQRDGLRKAVKERAA